MNSSVVRVTEASYCDHDGEEGGDDEVEKDVNDKSDLENDDGDDQYSLESFFPNHLASLSN